MALRRVLCVSMCAFAILSFVSCGRGGGPEGEEDRGSGSSAEVGEPAPSVSSSEWQQAPPVVSLSDDWQTDVESFFEAVAKVAEHSRIPTHRLGRVARVGSEWEIHLTPPADDNLQAQLAVAFWRATVCWTAEVEAVEHKDDCDYVMVTARVPEKLLLSESGHVLTIGPRMSLRVPLNALPQEGSLRAGRVVSFAFTLGEDKTVTQPLGVLYGIGEKERELQLMFDIPPVDSITVEDSP